MRQYDVNMHNVPKLPVPSVEATMTRFLETMKPLLTQSEFEQTSLQTKKFVESNDAKRLQELVLKKAAGTTYPYHYFEDAWDDMYYGGRWPLNIHVNPCFSLFDAQKKDAPELELGAKYVSSMVRFWRKFVEGRLEPDMENGTLLCGYQYPLLFGTERVPDLTRDLFIPHGEDSKHIVVVHKHRYYRVDMVRPGDGAVLSADALLLEFERIRKDPRGAALVEEDVGVLTAGQRDTYYKGRHQLIKTSPNVNGRSFKDLDTCLFVVCLEDAPAASAQDLTALNLHGLNGTNRWFDKHQVIIHADGNVGMCMEHGCGDGMTWMRMLNEVYADLFRDVKAPYSRLDTKVATSAITPARPLDFTINSPQSKKDMTNALDFAKSQVSDCDLSQERFTEYGSERFKSWKVSPDSTMQMAFQLAYARVNPTKSAPAVYEACAMKNFFHGRTETIRSCTVESQAMVKAFNDVGASAEAKRAALVKATQKHTDISKGARSCTGPNIGVDRHMLGLRTAATDNNIPMPEVFTHANFSKGNTWNLSTSNVTASFIEAFAFGAVCNTGYGLGYMTTPGSLPITVSSFKSGQTAATSSKALGAAIKAAIKDFESVQAK